MIDILRLLRANWGNNHRHHGSLRAPLRCLLGSLALGAGIVPHGRRPPPRMEVLSFSVVPWMTAAWARLLGGALNGTGIWIGDCSGGLRGRVRHFSGERTRVLPFANAQHGDKLDLFLAKVCRSPLVLVADDDVFWLDDQPLRWAMEQLKADPEAAVVSLLPRQRVSSVLAKHDIRQPMGSHCLLLRRDVWIREGLSFAVAPSSDPASDWFYDTGDQANHELLQRGYRIPVAPADIRQSFVAFDGISTWILKLQGHTPARLAKVIGDIEIRQNKAFQALCFARGLPTILAGLGIPNASVVAESRLDAAERELESLLPASRRSSLSRDTTQRLETLRDALSKLR